jgi:hypothetical protein
MSGEGRSKRITITRPANQTPYTAEDAVGDTSGSAILEFPGLVVPGQTFFIMSATIEYHVAALPSGCDFRLELYNASPGALADNAAWSLISGDRGKHLCSIDFDAPTDRVATLKAEADKINKLVDAGASRSLFGFLVAAGGFTPAANSEVLAITLAGAPI